MNQILPQHKDWVAELVGERALDLDPFGGQVTPPVSLAVPSVGVVDPLTMWWRAIAMTMVPWHVCMICRMDSRGAVENDRPPGTRTGVMSLLVIAPMRLDTKAS